MLIANWLLWSGHFGDPFLFMLGASSCLFTLWLSRRMRIIDEESAPVQLGVRPFTRFMPWLVREIVISNIAVAKTILSPNMRLRRNMISIRSTQQSQLGRVILANSITLTPGTVAIDVVGDQIKIHALSLEEADDDMTGRLNRRICRLERGL